MGRMKKGLPGLTGLIKYLSMCEGLWSFIL